MADSDRATRPQRSRRQITNSQRDNIYCYEPIIQKQSQQQGISKQQPNDDSSDHDGSFTYGVGKYRKKQKKNKKIDDKSHQKKNKSKIADSVQPSRSRNLRLKIKGASQNQDQFVFDKQDQIANKLKKSKLAKNKIRQKKQQSIIDNCYVQYVPSQKPKQAELKIFNPELYIQNIQLKARYQKQLQQLYEKFGKKLQKAEQPTFNNIRWKYLVRQVEEAGKDFMSERQQRIKLKRKIAKFSQNTWNRLENIKEQRVKDQEKKIRKQGTELMRLVKKQFWGSGMKVRKVMLQEERKKIEKQAQMKKLEDLVAKQFDASQKITKMLQGYEQVSLQNVQVSQQTNIPVTIEIQTRPHYKYLGLHQDNIIRPSLLIKFPLREYQLLGVYWISTLHNRGMNAILADQMGLGKTIQTISFFAHLAIQKGIWGPHLIIVPTTILMNWEIQFKRWCPAFKIMTYFGSPKERKLKRKGWSKLNSFHVCITSYKIAVTDNPIFRRKKWYYMVLDQAQNIKNFKSQRWQVLLNFKTKHRLLLTGTPLQNDLTELWSLLHFLMPKVFSSFDDFNQWFNIPFQQAMQKNFPISQQILKKLHTILRPFFLRRLKKDVQKQLPTKSQRIIRCGMSRRQKYLYDQMIWHENKKQKNHEAGGMMNVLMGLKKICNHPDLFQPRIQQSPLNWVPLTVLIAHHMFVKSQFAQEKIHILKDFVDNFRTEFQQIAEDILKDYNQHTIPPENLIYYRNKYMDRMFFARINYERSKRKQFKVYNFQFRKFELYQQKVPYYMSKNIVQRAQEFEGVFDRFLFAVPRVMARPAHLATFPMNSEVQSETNRLEYLRIKVKDIIPREVQCIRSRFLLHFPSKTIILYDSGKLMKLVFLLKAIKYRGQKALVFTQMTKMLDIFQKVLNMFKFNYVRLDGGTKTQLRQTIVQRFNNDPRVLCFISSTRSGGIGLNLTGASNVIFYDTDWNPAMDKQAQDRCHRIGQTRNVIIYRLITEYSIEQNILMKSIQKRRLEELVTEQGMFNTSYFQKVNIKDMLMGAIEYVDDNQQADLAQVEDAQDRAMLQAAQKQNKDRREEDQQEVDVQMLPKLFRYCLKMLDNQQMAHAINTQLSDNQFEEDYQEEQEVDSQQASKEQGQKQPEEVQVSPRRPKDKNATQSQKTNHNSIRNHKLQRISDNQLIEEQNIQPQQSSEEEKIEQQAHHHFLSTQDRLKAMAIYQSEYSYMKQHYFYSDSIAIGVEQAMINEENAKNKEQNPQKNRNRRRDRNRKKRKR